jgi:diaminopimelate decarboxylase/aspartate kinase
VNILNKLNLLKFETPVYLYSLEVLHEKINELQELNAIHRFFYAVKANHHPQILDYLCKHNFSFECISLEEIQHVRKHLGRQFLPQNILFTPNFCSIAEIKQALELGCHVTLDSLYFLATRPEVFKNSSLFLRFDLNIGAGHHPHVVTGGHASKFGIAVEDIVNVAALCKNYKISIQGLHCHPGSGIFDIETWPCIAETLQNLASTHFPDTPMVLNLGGGLGIPMSSEESSLDLKNLNKRLLQVQQKVSPLFEYWMEPGRFLVAEAGVLMTTLTQLKTKSGQNFVGLNTGMNSLVRTAMYNAIHPVINFTQQKEPHDTVFKVVGPICESGDQFGTHKLPRTSKEGDHICILNTGAYGATMSSAYNLRQPAKEIVID